MAKCYRCQRDSQAFEEDPWWRKAFCRRCLEWIVREFIRAEPDLFREGLPPGFIPFAKLDS